MKYIRNLHNKDDKVLSVSPQTGKDTRVFGGIIIVFDEHKYCIPLSSPKAKHKKEVFDVPPHKKLDFLSVVVFDYAIFYRLYKQKTPENIWSSEER